MENQDLKPIGSTTRIDPEVHAAIIAHIKSMPLEELEYWLNWRPEGWTDGDEAEQDKDASAEAPDVDNRRAA